MNGDEGSSGTMRLLFCDTPPSAPFADVQFEVSCIVCDELGSPVKPSEFKKRKVQAALLHPLTQAPDKTGALKAEGGEMEVVEDVVRATVKLIIADQDPKGPAQRYRLHLSVVDDDSIVPALSEPMTAVRQSLDIRDGSKPIPDQWFKDEGGRENCVELSVRLVDSAGKEIGGRQVPLRLVLLYGNEQQVQNQEILKLAPDSRLVLDEEGCANLRVRIEEVSKNHQKQAFRVRVEPDNIQDASSSDVASAVSKPITVLSKRIQKRRSKINGRKVAVPVEADGSGSDANFMPRDQEGGGKDGGAVAPPAVDMESISVYDALKGVIQWTTQVVEGLQSFEWQLMGYDRKQDGQPDPNRPFYHFTNPNVAIKRILHMYANDTMVNLHVLLRRIEEANLVDDGSQSAPAERERGVDRDRERGERERVPPSGQGGGGAGGIGGGDFPVLPSHPRKRPRHAPSGGRDMRPNLEGLPGGVHPGMGEMHFGSVGSQMGNHGERGEGAMPGMAHTSGYGGNIPLQRQRPTAQRQPPLLPPQPHESFSGPHGFPPQMDSLELTVYYILAKGYTSSSLGVLGFPAFDINQYLLGFYMGNAEGGMSFVPFTRIQGLEPADTQAASSIFKDALKKGSQSIFSMPSCGNNLQQMKEYARMYYISKLPVPVSNPPPGTKRMP